MMTRRQAMAASAGALICSAAGTQPSKLSLEGYIWQNIASREKRPLADMLGELYAAAVEGGYRNIELNDGFFTPALRPRVLELTRSNHLSMPSVYVGGGMHTDVLAEQTIARALEIGGACKEFGCIAIVNNPNTKPENGAKTDEELSIQARALDRMGLALQKQGMQLRIHHHAAEMADAVREWRHILHHTDARYVSLCIDIEHAFRSGVDPNMLLREAGNRTAEVHLRSTRKEVPLETFEEGDINHAIIAQTIRELKIEPLFVVELAYHSDTPITRSFAENLRVSRINAEKMFGL
jgi:inosose dehydratase